MTPEATLFVTGLLASAIRLSTPLIFAALGGFFSERAGVVNIALEGILLIGAFAGAVGAHYTGSPWLGLAAGMTAGAAFGLIHAVACVYGRADQIVSGTAVNLLALGATAVIAKVLFGVTGSTPALPMSARFHEWTIPGLSAVPLVGSLVFDQIPLVYMAVLAAPAAHFVFTRTRFGLRLRSAGEAPEAAEAAGIAVLRLRVTAVVLGSALAGAGGVFLSVGHASGFARNMSAGRGFIALAALILAGWKPLPVLAAACLFGFGDALSIALQGVDVPGLGRLPVQFVQMFPYVLTLAALVGLGRKPRPPAGLGLPYPR